ncbi:hypothetical protein BKK51_09410 [Rodentibacter trehalosifermentans]|uniref:DUF600 family protein n=1 Tax=Rodentibacter trehalosifermentans TaxID=1908263 RepID=A0A1V3IPQ7_9PAST|nr:hypothetical protein [Rodentibacter trehalosifermentans]OOF44217.1 hypothetical protein BKK51_09410 [Rodentibacter trehalosifermentans]OOF49239.1 hypothetical protein BKK52_04165 [Rodentibacter trehalosifermentans]
MKEQEIYQRIGELLWSIMPEEAVRIDFLGDIYPEHYSGGAQWVLANGEDCYFPMGGRPYEIEREIIDLMHKLKEISSQEWTQYIFSLTNDMAFNIKFAYVPEDDSWGSLYMKGISDLTWEEADKYNIPREIWEERVKAKAEKQDS